MLAFALPSLPGESSGNVSALCSTARLRSSTPTGNIPEAPELETPRWKGHIVGSQWCPLLRGSTITWLSSILNPAVSQPVAYVQGNKGYDSFYMENTFVNQNARNFIEMQIIRILN